MQIQISMTESRKYGATKYRLLRTSFQEEETTGNLLSKVSVVYYSLTFLANSTWDLKMKRQEWT